MKILEFLYLFNIDFDSSVVVLVQGLEGTWIRSDQKRLTVFSLKSLRTPRTSRGVKLTTHGIEPDEAADVVIKIHVAIFITVSADDHLEELVIEGEPCRSQDTTVTSTSTRIAHPLTSIQTGTR